MFDNLGIYLIEIGLTESEAKVYLALLDHYKLTAKEIAQVTGIFRTQTYDVLNSLIKKGFCTKVFDKVKNYVPIDPRLAMETYLNDYERKVRLTRNLSLQLHQKFVNNQNNEHNQEKMIEVVHSEKAIRKRLRANYAATKNVMLSFSKPPYSLRYTTDKKEVLNISELRDRRVKHRTLYQIDINDLKGTLHLAQESTQKGEIVRISSYLPIRMTIFDNQRVFYQLSADKTFSSTNTGTFITHPEITLTLINAFWFEWERSVALEEFRKELER